MPNHLPVALQDMTPREQIIDTLYRCVNAFDVPDDAMLDSCFFTDAVWTFTGSEGMPQMNGIEEIRSKCYDNVSKLDTLHLLANFRVNLDAGGRAAALTCNGTARHMRPGTATTPGSPHFTSGAIYNVDLAKDETDGLWKIKKFVLNLIWLEGDSSVMAG